MTDERGEVIRWRFNFAFWRPIKAIGGRVWFGWCAEVKADGEITQQTPLQVTIKRQMGIMR